MEHVTSFGDIKDALAQHAGAEAADATLEPLVRELWLRVGQPPERDDAGFDSVEQVAVAYVEALEPASAAVEKVLRAGRALTEVAEGSERLDSQGVARLRRLVDRAAVEVARAIELGRGGRRGAWLSFFSHELKNPLNTMLNALWLLRERGADARQAGRFIELAERAVKKLEERVRDLKALDQQLGALPPGWEGRLIPKRR